MRSARGAPRPPAVAAEAMVTSSQPLATRAGLRTLERGGNAVDAVLAAAAVTCVTEPYSTGPGGDAVAIVWRDGAAIGLDAAGPAPRRAAPTPVAERGPRSVTVPGAVRGWGALAERFGRLGLDRCLADAVDAAEQGFAVGARTAGHWARFGGPGALGRVPRLGDRVIMPELAATLRAIAHDGPDVLYTGALAERIAVATWLDVEDLTRYAPRWVDTLAGGYRGLTVHELPPPAQGVAALEGLALLALGEPSLVAAVECVRLALEDAHRRVRDGADVADLLDPAWLADRRRRLGPPVLEPAGGTVAICAVDGDGMAVSFMQSLFGPFGSGVAIEGTGVLMQNRAAGFAIGGRVEPGRRPYHTTIPALLVRDGELVGPLGMVGGAVQAQAQVQVVSALVDEGADAQAAVDRPRFRLAGEVVELEEDGHAAEELRRRGLDVRLSEDTYFFGGGQLITVHDDVLIGGSDTRHDGFAAGF